jgi:hypothetical protein
MSAVTAQYLGTTHMLGNYLQRIETRYATSIELIEASSHDWPIAVASEGASKKKDAILQSIRESLSDEGVASASWSFDGHHGALVLSPWKAAGVSISPFYRAASSSGLHFTRFGTAVDGRPVIVFDGSVPKGKMKHYQLVFFSELL